MKCPYCGKEMERGFIQSRDGVYWTENKRLFPVLNSLRKGSISLANDTADNSYSVQAYRCGICKKVIIDYSSESE